MDLTASPDNPIHRLRTSEFAQLMERYMLEVAGGRERMSHGKSPDGNIESTFPDKFTGNRITVETERPSDNPMGPPLAMTSSVMLRVSKEQRIKNGLKPNFQGGVTGTFNDLHKAFIGAGAAFGAVLDKDRLGNDEAQKARIQALLAQWSDHQSADGRREVAWEPGGDYPQQLAAELATVEKVPLKLTIGNKKIPFVVDNVRIGLEKAPLAHVLVAVEKNALALNGRPEHETRFIIQAVNNFSNILVSTDQVHDYLREQLVGQGVPDPDKMLKDSKLTFDSERAERILLNHAPMLKLANVIAPLAFGYASESALNPILKLVGQQVEEIPPVHNAEQGARLLEALLFRLGEYEDRCNHNAKIGDKGRELGIDSKAIKTALRTSALERPFDVAHLSKDAGVVKMLAIAASMRGGDKNIDRALKTYEHALEMQASLAAERDAIKKATTYTPGRLRRVLDRVREGQVQVKPHSSLVEAIDSGMNRNEFDALMRDVIAMFDDKSQDKNFSDAVRQEMKNRAARSSGNVPPL